MLLFFLTLPCIVATFYEKFELQCQKRLSQINILVPIRLKIKRHEIFIKWDSWINFLFMQGQHIVNNCDFSSKIPRHCHKKLVQKFFGWHVQRELFVRKSLCDRLDCLIDFVGMILFCLLPLPNCFFRVCFLTLFAAVLRVFLPLITSPISGAANSISSAPMRFAAGKKYSSKKGIEALAITYARATYPVVLCLPTAL